MLTTLNTRRSLLIGAGAGLVAAVPVRCAVAEAKDEKEVGAVEDLMREHGVLRRALLVYRESAAKLRDNQGSDLGALNKTAKLFRRFGEDYHEKKLEEAHIFPALDRAGPEIAGLISVLAAQHQRGREITDYILASTGKRSLPDALGFADVLDGFVLMYQNHAAREDTVIFPAWKEALSEAQLHEMGEAFEEIEHKQFGKDGYEDAVKEIAAIETALGFADLSQFTPPPPKI